MNRGITNRIRFFMDECLPPIIRDNKYFMWPFYFFAYRGKNLKQVMNFKTHVYNFSAQEYDTFYSNLDTISRNRLTDLNNPSLKFILDHIDKSAKEIIDVGCGKGYLLKQIKMRFPIARLIGADVVNKLASSEYEYVKANIENLPFKDKSFDVVISSHTIEHIIHLDKALRELIRVARKQIILVTPCQRYFYHTLDEHVNFFPYKEQLTSHIHLKNYTCDNILGDWVYVGQI